MSAAAMDKLKTLLSNSSTFQDECEAADAAEALDYIFLHDVERADLVDQGIINPNRTLALMYAVIVQERDDDSRAVAGGGATVYRKNGELKILIKAPRAGTNDAAEAQAFAVALDAIYGEMAVLAGSEDFLHVRHWLVRGPWINDDKETDLKPYAHGEIIAAWGFEG